MATIDQIGEALKNAHASGDTEAASKLAHAYKDMQSQPTPDFKRPERSYDWTEVPEQFVKNLPSTGGKVLEGIANMVVHPIDTLSQTLQLAGGELGKVLPESVNKVLNKYDFNPEATQKGEEMAGAVNAQYAKDYGSIEGIKRKLAEDPAGFLMDLSTIASGGGALAAKVPALAKPAVIASKIGTYTNPLEMGVNLGGKVLTNTYDILSGAKPRVNAGKIARGALGATLEPTLAMLKNAPQDLTAAQGAYGSATPAFASLEGLASSSRGEPYLAKDLASQAENRNIMGAMTPNKEQALANEAQVIANRTGQLTQGQDVLNTALANQVRGFEAGTTKGVSQVPHGEIIAGQKNALEQGASNAVKPLYAQAFDLAPQKFDVANVATAAENIKGHLASIINPDTKPEIADAITKVFQSTPATKGREVTNLATGNKYRTGATPAIPPQASLQDLDEVSKGITAALSDARMAASPDNTLISNLNNLKTEVNKAISANVSDEALAAYDNAKKVWLKTVHEPFREGEVRKLTKENVSGRPMTLPENAAKQFLSSESGAADFNRAFGNDPDAKEALNSGIEHLMLKAKNPETFLTDNKLKLDELGKTNPDLQPRLDRLAEQLRGFKAVQGSLEAESKLIPEKVAAEIAAAPSAANQERVISHLRNILHPFPGQENASPFLSALEKADVSSLNAPQQQFGLNTIQAKLLRNADLAQQAEAGRGTLKKAWDENTFMQKLPSYLNATTSTANKALDIVERKVAGATERAISKGMESPENAIEMLNMLPADERVALIKGLRKSATPFSKTAPVIGYETNQNKE